MNYEKGVADMKYKNAAEILSEKLLQELQIYISGDIIVYNYGYSYSCDLNCFGQSPIMLYVRNT